MAERIRMIRSKVMTQSDLEAAQIKANIANEVRAGETPEGAIARIKKERSSKASFVIHNPNAEPHMTYAERLEATIKRIRQLVDEHASDERLKPLCDKIRSLL